MSHPVFDCFEQVRIINLIDRPDRRREMIRQLDLLGGVGANVDFYEARRPTAAAGFPSVGARGCFESHLAVLRSARAANVRSLLILEDDLDFSRDARARLNNLVPDLTNRPWDIFYGAHLLPAKRLHGLLEVPSDEPIATTSFVAVGKRVIGPLVDCLEAMLGRPPGSPDYGPMHVDGAYTVFRRQNPRLITLVAFPPLGRQRSSPSDVTPTNMVLDRWAGTRKMAALLRRGYNVLRRF